MRATRTRRASGFVGSPTIRVDGRDVQPPGGEPAGLTCRVYRLRDGRISPLPDRADVARGARSALEGEEMTARMPPRWATCAPARACPTPRASPARFPPARRGAGDGRRLDLQPLPVRARLARSHSRRRARLRRARRPLPGGQLERRRALPGRLARRDARALRAPRTGRSPICTTRARRRARAWGAADDARTFTSSTPTCGSATRARRTPTTWTRRSEAAWLRAALDAILAGDEPSRRSTDPVGCSIKWR